MSQGCSYEEFVRFVEERLGARGGDYGIAGGLASGEYVKRLIELAGELESRCGCEAYKHAVRLIGESLSRAVDAADGFVRFAEWVGLGREALKTLEEYKAAKEGG